MTIHDKIFKYTPKIEKVFLFDSRYAKITVPFNYRNIFH